MKHHTFGVWDAPTSKDCSNRPFLCRTGKVQNWGCYPTWRVKNPSCSLLLLRCKVTLLLLRRSKRRQETRGRVIWDTDLFPEILDNPKCKLVQDRYTLVPLLFVAVNVAPC